MGHAGSVFRGSIAAATLKPRGRSRLLHAFRRLPRLHRRGHIEAIGSGDFIHADGQVFRGSIAAATLKLFKAEVAIDDRLSSSAAPSPRPH